MSNGYKHHPIKIFNKIYKRFKIIMALKAII